MKDPNKVKLGKKTRAAGKRFEKLVEKDLEEKGWIVTKWGKQVEFHSPQKDTHKQIATTQLGDTPIGNCKSNGVVSSSLMGSNYVCGKLVNCKPKFNFFTKSLMMNSGGFPDFLCIKTQHTIKPLFFKFPGPDYDEEAVRKFKEALAQTYKTSPPEILVCGGNVEHIEPPSLMLVESKTNNKLDKIEKDKMAWIEDNLRIPCYVAYPEKVGRKTEVKLRRWNQ
jgi:hypothetical protein